MNAQLKKYPPISIIDIGMEPEDHPPPVKHSPNTPLRRSSGLFLKGPYHLIGSKKPMRLGGAQGSLPLVCGFM